MSRKLREQPAAMTNCTNTGFRPQNPSSEEDRNLNTNTESIRILTDLEREVTRCYLVLAVHENTVLHASS